MEIRYDLLSSQGGGLYGMKIIEKRILGEAGNLPQEFARARKESVDEEEIS